VSMVNDFLAVFYDHDATRDNFTVQVFRLIAKADPFNLVRLARAFPNEVAVYVAWMARPELPPRQEVPMIIARALMELVER
jgi:hypothetical protein